ncbi:MAG: hypothetical protein OJF58_000128 [Enhydrobacter sp.]|jgi:hypothetical protein|nr:MAG: hypothetical protein OJF58_000128 [Enhydrobacter sp.]
MRYKKALKEVGEYRGVTHHRVKWYLFWFVVSVLVVMVVGYEAEPFLGMTGRCVHSDGDC